MVLLINLKANYKKNFEEEQSMSVFLLFLKTVMQKSKIPIKFSFKERKSNNKNK